MKIIAPFFTILFLVLIPQLGKAQEYERTAVFTIGSLPAIKTLLDRYGPFAEENCLIAEIETGNDSVHVKFGLARNADLTMYWTAIMHRDSLISYGAGFRLEEKKDGTKCGKIMNFLGPSFKEVHFHACISEAQNSLNYHWLTSDDQPSGALVLEPNIKFEIGKTYPNFKHKDLDGNFLNDDLFQGQVRVINWWNTGCRPCIAEMPDLNRLVLDYAKNDKIVFLAIADNSALQVSKFLNNHEFNYSQTLTNSEIKQYFGPGYPVHMIVGKDGKISFLRSGGGQDIYEILKKEIERIVHP
jgi:thiol-disulfide isomerase/thioredoxin